MRSLRRFKVRMCRLPGAALLPILTAGSTATSGEADVHALVPYVAARASLPHLFEPSDGKLHPDVRFLTRAIGPKAFLTDEGPGGETML